MSELEICLIYSLFKIKVAIAKAKLCHFLTDLDLTDYFSVVSAIPDLVGNELIRLAVLGGDEYLIITNKGKEFFELNEKNLPKAAKDKIDNAANVYLKGEYNLSKVFTKITPLREDCYIFSAGVLENDETVFEIKLRAKNKEELEDLEKNFRLNWNEIHQNLLGML